jgi:hypothetical protein
MLCINNTGIIMKKTDLEKAKGLKLAGNMKLNGIPDRFGKDAGALVDKREQRKRDQELGLIPFAVKLHGDLIKQIKALAEKQEKSLNDITAELLTKGLAKK